MLDLLIIQSVINQSSNQLIKEGISQRAHFESTYEFLCRKVSALAGVEGNANQSKTQGRAMFCGMLPGKA